MNKSHMVITAVGDDKPGLVNELSQAILDGGCNLEDSRMTVLGGEFAVLLLVTGNWNTIAKLENTLQSLQTRLGMSIQCKRTGARRTATNLLPYAVDVVSIDHPGIVFHLTEFFSGKNINIEELVTSSYRAAHTGTPMFSVHMEVSIPSELHIPELRDAFMDFCDELNLDAVIEPIRG